MSRTKHSWPEESTKLLLQRMVHTSTHPRTAHTRHLKECDNSSMDGDSQNKKATHYVFSLSLSRLVLRYIPFGFSAKTPCTVHSAHTNLPVYECEYIHAGDKNGGARTQCEQKLCCTFDGEKNERMER